MTTPLAGAACFAAVAGALLWTLAPAPVGAQGTTATVRVNLPVTAPVGVLQITPDIAELGELGSLELGIGEALFEPLLVRIRANRSFSVRVAAPDAFSAPDAKPVSDVAWSLDGAAFVPMSGGAGEVFSRPDGAAVTRAVALRVSWSYASDPPGPYALRVDFTLDAP